MQSNFLADSQIAAGKLVDGKAKPCHDGEKGGANATPQLVSSTVSQ